MLCNSDISIQGLGSLLHFFSISTAGTNSTKGACFKFKRGPIRPHSIIRVVEYIALIKDYFSLRVVQLWSLGRNLDETAFP